MEPLMQTRALSYRERERLEEAMRLAHWSHERAEQLARTALFDVALGGVDVVRAAPERGRKK